MLFAAMVLACSTLVIDADSMVGNEVVCSANGRYCAVVRRHEELADFTTMRAGTLFGWDDAKPAEGFEPEPPADEPPPRESVIAALYEFPMRRLIAEVPIDAGDAFDVLVADSGHYLVGQPTGECGRYGFGSGERLLTIYRADRSRAGALSVGDVFNPHDVRKLGSVEVELRSESDRREVIVIKVGAKTERRIDLATATLLDEKRDIYPRPRVSVTETDAASAEEPLGYTDCPFHSPLLVRLESAEFLRRAISMVLPEMPIVAIKARIHGQVRADVMVSGYGEVLCVRSSSLPFGLSEAAEEAVKQWRFRPLFVNGRRNAFVGEVLFHFPE